MTDVGLDQHVGRVLGERYRLVSPVGTGASARVYLAEDTTLRRRVAVKLLHSALASDLKFRKRFRAEAHSAAQLSHPNVMAVFDWSDAGDATGATGAADAPAYLVTELLTGGSLRSMLDEGHRLSLSQALVVGLHAAEGLAYAHYNGFVHRDVKPANLLFGSEGRLRIADFGIARAVAESSWTEPEGALVGTARYAAPEQASGSAVDGRADVYGLALTVIEAVTGETPLVGSTPLATMVMRQDTDIPIPDELGPLADALENAGRANVDERSTAEEFAAALKKAASKLERPQKLPLTGLERDPRAGGAPTVTLGMKAHDDETVALVLDDATASLDLSEPPQVLPARPDVEETVDRDVAPDPDLDVVDDDDMFEDNEDQRRIWPALLLLGLLLIAAVLAVQNRGGRAGDDAPAEAEIITHPVGTYVGRMYDDVLAEVDVNNWTLFSSDGRADDSEPGQIIEQSPAPGFELAEGLEVTVVVSEGQSFRTVPLLEGLVLADALDALAVNGLFLGKTAEAFDENVPAGQVVTASIEVGVEVETGTPVDLVWSLGPAPRVIPELTSFVQVDAENTLTELGLTFVVVTEHSQTIAQGEVIRTEPGIGAELDRGSEVTIVVSLGLPFIEVPNVVGMTAAEAADVLTGAGFIVIDTVGPPNSEVLATDPPAGESHRQGTEIVIFTRR